MKKMLLLTLILVVLLSGCQFDLEGPKTSWKWLYKDENGENNDIWKSRNTGAFSEPIISSTTTTQSRLPMVGQVTMGAEAPKK